MSPASPPSVSTGSCVTIGNFDGVHLGHQRLIEETINKAREDRLEPTLVTFWPHPGEIVSGRAPHMPLLARSRKLALLKETGIGRILEMDFTPELATLGAEEFVRTWLLPLNIKKLIVGHDFSLGHKREGDFPCLKEIGKKFGFEVIKIPAFTVDGEPVSSTRLRRAIMKGDVALARRLLGRPWLLEGQVTHGFGRGKGLGFPTANVETGNMTLPGDGVYATFAITPEGRFQAVTNIGKNPTFGGQKRTIESFLLNTNADLYDKNMELHFIERLRTESKFASSEELKKQIDTDIAKARAILDKDDFARN